MSSNVDEDVKAAYMELFESWDEDDCGCGYRGEFCNVTELAEDYVESIGMLNDVDEDIAVYFDYKAYGRDMILGGDVREHNGHYFSGN